MTVILGLLIPASTAHSVQPIMRSLSRRETQLSLVLRIFAVLDLAALVAVVMPEPWMASTYSGLGLGELQASPVFVYLARTLSLLYAFQGATFWYLAGDVRRYRGLIALWGWLTLGGSLVFLGIDYHAGLPTWWCVGEFLCVGSIGMSLTILERRLDNPMPVTSHGTSLSADIDDAAEVSA